MGRLLRGAALLASLALLPAATAASGFVPGTLVTLPYVSPADGAAREYAFRIPETWDGTSPLPAVLFLHGRGGTRRQFQRPEIFAEADARGALLVSWEGRIVPGGTGVPSTEYVDGVAQQ